MPGTQTDDTVSVPWGQASAEPSVQWVIQLTKHIRRKKHHCTHLRILFCVKSELARASRLQGVKTMSMAVPRGYDSLLAHVTHHTFSRKNLKVKENGRGSLAMGSSQAGTLECVCVAEL